MASPPSHPFWNIVFAEIISSWGEKPQDMDLFRWVLEIAGPAMLTRVAAENPDMVHVRSKFGENVEGADGN
jgi:hypothetical protein